VSQLSPSDFLNTTTAFKQLITGFVSRDDREQLLFPSNDLTKSIPGKGKATATLVPYDMQLLLSWFRWKTRRKLRLSSPVNGLLGTIPSKLSLVALIPDFESCNVEVLEQFIHICRSTHFSSLLASLV
jgi:hypothetical protein